jgi:hypothetical protein
MISELEVLCERGAANGGRVGAKSQAITPDADQPLAPNITHFVCIDVQAGSWFSSG